MRRLFVLSAVPALALALFSACAPANDHPAALEGGIDPSDGGPIVDICNSSPTEQGCPCADAGAPVVCQAERFGADAYKSCGPGTRSCGADGKWGACVGASVWDGGP